MVCEAPLQRVSAAAYEIPTDAPEADGTLEWDRTVLVVVEVDAGGQTGLGYTYSDASIVSLIEKKLASVIVGYSAFDIAGANRALWRSVRNLGRSGLVATAISAVDAAVWDLKAKLLGVSVVALLGCCRDAVPIYGSGGFTCYADARLRDQLADWVLNDGCRWVKMKIGSEPARDPQRVGGARDAIGDAGSVRRCQRRVLGETGIGSRGTDCRVRRRLVRGTGQLGRCRRAGTNAGTRTGRDGHCSRRIRLHAR